MQWIDVAGPPGVGKSSLCDSLWGPHAIDWKNTEPPPSWRAFIDEIDRLFNRYLRWHWSADAAARMTNRSVRKMATVAQLADDGPYIQTGFIQRGLGYGWRLKELGAPLDELRPFFELMPVSLGAVFLTASEPTIVARNKRRLLVPETSHENRAFMVPLMLPAIEIAKEVLGARGIAIRTIDVEGQSVDDARAELVKFASEQPIGLAPDGYSGKVAVFPASNRR